MKNTIFIVASILYLLVSTTKITNLKQWNKISPDDVVALSLDKESTNELSAVAKMFSSIIILSYSFLIINRINKLKTFGLLFLLLYMLYITISCFWALNPIFSLRKCVQVWVYFVIVLFIIVSENPLVLLKKIITYYGLLVVVLSLILIVFMPSYGWMDYENTRLPVGIFAHKNSLGYVSLFLLVTLGLFFNLSNNKKDRIFYCIMLILSMLLLVISGSRAAQIIAIICVFVYLFSTISVRFSYESLIVNCIILVQLLLLVLCSVYLFVHLVAHTNEPITYIIDGILNISGKDKTLTGRTELWASLLSFMLYTKSSNIIIGAGFDSFFLPSNVMDITRQVGWYPVNSHNGFVEVLLNFGIIGLIIFTINIVYLLIAGIKLIYKKTYNLFQTAQNRIIMTYIILLIVFLISNIVENVITCQIGNLIFFTLWLFCSCMRLSENKTLKIDCI